MSRKLVSESAVIDAQIISSVEALSQFVEDAKYEKIN